MEKKIKKKKLRKLPQLF